MTKAAARLQNQESKQTLKPFSSTSSQGRISIGPGSSPMGDLWEVYLFEYFLRIYLPYDRSDLPVRCLTYQPQGSPFKRTIIIFVAGKGGWNDPGEHIHLLGEIGQHHDSSLENSAKVYSPEQVEVWRPHPKHLLSHPIHKMFPFKKNIKLLAY